MLVVVHMHDGCVDNLIRILSFVPEFLRKIMSFYNYLMYSHGIGHELFVTRNEAMCGVRWIRWMTGPAPITITLYMNELSSLPPPPYRHQGRPTIRHHAHRSACLCDWCQRRVKIRTRTRTISTRRTADRNECHLRRPRSCPRHPADNRCTTRTCTRTHSICWSRDWCWCCCCCSCWRSSGSRRGWTRHSCTRTSASRRATACPLACSDTTAGRVRCGAPCRAGDRRPAFDRTTMSTSAVWA